MKIGETQAAPDTVVESVSLKNQPERKRIYLGGLSADVSQTDLMGRFGPLMTAVHSIDMVPAKRQAYLDADCSEAQLKKCMKLLSGTKWKGSSLKIEVAKPSFLDQLEKERQLESDPTAASEATKKDKKKRKQEERNWKPYQFAKDMSVITTRNCKDRRFWKRLPSGKLVRMMRVRMPGSKRITVVDPGKHLEQFKNFRYTATDKMLSGTGFSGGNKVKPGFLLPQVDLPKRQKASDIVDDDGKDHEGNNFISAQEEKSNALAVLSQIFGEPAVAEPPKPSRVEPRNSPSSSNEETKTTALKELKAAKSAHNNNDDLIPDTSTDTSADFNAENKKMKSLFFGETEVKPSPTGFSFSILPAEEAIVSSQFSEQATSGSTPALKAILPKTDVFVEEARKSEQTPFLFCYSGNPRSIFDPTESFTPQHIISSKEEMMRFWSGVKEELTMEYKKQRKNSQRLVRK